MAKVEGAAPFVEPELKAFMSLRTARPSKHTLNPDQLH
jgi:hypothetical protein